MSYFLSFTLSTYRFTITAHQPLYLPLFKGNALRGGFGHAFKAMVCGELEDCDQRCNLGNACVYGYIFETSPPEDTEVLRNLEKVPRPFIIEPPLDGRREYAPGDTLTFHLKLIGYANEFLAYFILAFRELGRRGLGRNYGHFRLSQVEAINPSSEVHFTVFDQTARNRLQLRSLPIDSATVMACAAALPIDRITLNFLTPTRLKHQEDWVRQGPSFQALIKVLLGRISSLSYFHCGERLDVDFRELIDRAADIQIVKSKTYWEDWSRFSGRQHQWVEMGGLVGRITYAGDLKDYLPLLALGELIHVGKGTVFGNGQYQIVRE